MTLPPDRDGRRAAARRNLVAAGLALAGHALVLALLLGAWQPQAPAAPRLRTLTAALVEVRPPAPPAAEPAPPAPEPVLSEPVQSEPVAAPPAPPEVALSAPAVPVPEPVLPEPAPVAPPPDTSAITVPAPPPVDEAALARRRIEAEKREQERRRRAEERARQQAEARAKAAAEAEARAAAEAAAEDARARQRAEAEAAEKARAAERDAASRPYLPIEKEAPDYPPRALDKRIEGDCTVVYRVNEQGRVEAPAALDDCHPLFVNPSLAAARRFRYQPRIVGGRAVAVEGVRNTFHFRIE
ncbi:energy transducer TonB [Zavarzinia compransoris]|uniref:Protein TonB n=1 Tax=Zavarzinia compransoris TaxID=1264899 RepID=A0A317E3H0_9PROT|nr:energy transducer TonB [Zavarzinia compransoris]PWR20924.1 energy transducer TonB [Zavarzinia compransoris]TDP44238.1 outer membrane transport energization protein TonB [Zavarzinia compransoris]